MKYFLRIGLFCCFSMTFAQSNEGFWDNARSANETIILNAGKRKIIKVFDLPTGTTEVVYRISLLDDNQKISSSLVSLLKAVPDPTGISVGAAGGVFLLSTISGDDKCKFAIFNNESDALNYEKNGAVKNACIVQDEPVNKVAARLSEKSKCMTQLSESLWFGFQSDNWVMKEKIVLEVVPWVNYNLRSGWTPENKTEILKIAEKLDVVQRLTNKDLFLGNFIGLLSSKYRYDDYKKLLAVEKAKLFDGLAEESLMRSGLLKAYLDAIRNEAKSLDLRNKNAEAIVLIQKELIDKGWAIADDYALQGSLYLSSKQFVKAEDAILKAIAKDQSELAYQLQLAHVYTLTGKVSQAKEIHRKYKLNHLSSGKSWVEQTKSDFKKFEENGFPTDNFKKIMRILE